MKREKRRMRRLLESAPLPRAINPETQQPQMRAEMYSNPIPKDPAYAEWYKRRTEFLQELKDG